MKPNIGHFVLSFDTELAWGYFDQYTPELYSHDGSYERKAIQRITSILGEYNVPATWAVVGQLFYQNHTECAFDPTAAWNGKYSLIKEMFQEDHPLLFAPDIIEMIRSCSTPQEIGFHGHTHTLFDEKLMSPERAELEIEAWKEAGKSLQIDPKTVIFPRNRIGHLDLFKKHGFTCYRGKELYPTKAYYLPFIGRIFRRFYYNLTAVTVPSRYSVETDPSGLQIIRGSQWLFGFNRKVELFLDRYHLSTLRLRTLATGVRWAAEEGKIIHVFAHPGEFKTEDDFQKLIFLLKTVSQGVKEGRLICSSMGQIATQYQHVQR